LAPRSAGPDRADVGVPRLAAAPPDLFDDPRGIGDRLGVGHRVHRGETAAGGGQGPRLDGLGVLAPRFAQVGVQVDQPGQGDQAVRVEDPRPDRLQPRPRLGDHTVAQEQIRRLLAEHPGTGDQDRFATHASPLLVPQTVGIHSAPSLVAASLAPAAWSRSSLAPSLTAPFTWSRSLLRSSLAPSLAAPASMRYSTAIRT